MKASCLLYSCLIIVIAIFTTVGCAKNRPPAIATDTSGGSYYSIRQFAEDQFQTYSGYPFSFRKITTYNGKKDTVAENADNIDWKFILNTFLASDISDKKYLGKYSFTMFEDDASQTRNFLYEANDKDLYTRKLQISADQFNSKIRSIYIETEKHSILQDESQKLLYKPTKVIQIQKFEKNVIGNEKTTITEYEFL